MGRNLRHPILWVSVAGAAASVMALPTIAGATTPPSEPLASTPASGATGSSEPTAASSGSAVATSTAPAESSPTGSAPAGPAVPEGTELLADGLDNPRGITIDADGTVWIAEAGGVPPADSAACLAGPEGNEVCYNATGAVSTVTADGAYSRVLTGLSSIGDRATGAAATGPHELAVGADGTVFLLFGLGADPATRATNEAGGPGQLGRLYTVDPATSMLTELADVAGFETTENADGGALDSNPFGIAPLSGGDLIITDAGANAAYRVTSDGTLSTIAVFPDRTAPAPDGSEIPMNAVPTGVAVDAADQAYVGELTGFPFPVDGANVSLVDPDGAEAEPTVAAEGFTNIIDVATAPTGEIYVLEYVSGGLLSMNPADPATMNGDLYRIDAPGAEPELVVTGLTTPTGVAVAADGTVYVTNNGSVAGGGQLLRVIGSEATTATSAPAATSGGDGEPAGTSPIESGPLSSAPSGSAPSSDPTVTTTD